MKFYFTDVGLRNALLNFRQIEETHLMENIIYNELLIRGYNVDVGVVDQYYTDENNQRRQKNLKWILYVTVVLTEYIFNLHYQYRIRRRWIKNKPLLLESKIPSERL